MITTNVPIWSGWSETSYHCIKSYIDRDMRFSIFTCEYISQRFQHSMCNFVSQICQRLNPWFLKACNYVFLNQLDHTKMGI